MLKSKPITGIILIIIASALIVAMNAFAKSISDVYDPIETVFIRNFLALIIITIFLITTKKTYAFRTKRLGGQIGRAVAGTIGLALVFWGFSLMPMANMQALMLTGGIMTAALAPFILQEHVRFSRWVAVILGFIGAVFVIQPIGNNFLGWPSLVGLFAAFWGGTLIGFFLRSLGRTESAWTTVFYFLLIGSFITLPYCLWTGLKYHDNTMIEILGIAITGGLSLLLKTQAYRYAEASLLSPITYFSLIWAILFGWIVFNDIPNGWVLFGSTLIISSNIFIAWKERHLNKVSNPR